MRITTWNTNGWRACSRKGFSESIAEIKPDIIMLQEIKMRPEQCNFSIDESYHVYMNPADRAGYSGTALLTKIKPIGVTYGLPGDDEGRLISAEYEDFYLLGMYSPNTKAELARIEYRLKWESMVQIWMSTLDKNKPVILCGDLNVAHNEIDLRYPESNRGEAGFSDEERGAFSKLLSLGFVDAFRHLYPDKVEYSYWSNFSKSRATSGWRLDYFVMSKRLVMALETVTHHTDVLGSDHCPVSCDVILR